MILATETGKQSMWLAATGAIFACGWALYAASLLPIVWKIAVTLAALAITIWLIVRARGGGGAWRARRGTRALFLANLAFEILLLNIALAVLMRVGRLDLLIPGIAAAVGVHFLPMAWIFGRRVYLALGGAMIGVAIVAMVVIVALRAAPAIVLPAEAGANALMLWATVAFAGRRPISLRSAAG
jgi:hypothetical protein